ncbi:MAG: hypothetical protein V1709_02815, partial [Planctomycetota bacterium]
GIILVNDSGKSELVISTTVGTEIRQAVGTLLNEILVPDPAAVDLVQSSLYTTGYDMFSLVGRKVGTYTREITLPEFPKFILIRYDNNWNLVEEKVASYRETITISERDEKELKSAIIDGNGQVGISGTELAEPLKIDISEYINYNKTNFIPYGGRPYNYLRSSFILGCTDGCYLLKTETGWSKEVGIFTEGVASVYVKVTSTQPLSGIWLRGITSEFQVFPYVGQPYIATFTYYPRTRCYAIPPEIKLVRKSVPEDNTIELYVEDEQIFPVNIYDESDNLVYSAPPSNETFIEYKTAVQTPQPSIITQPLKSLDICGGPLRSGYAPSEQNIELQFINSTDRYALYRSGPIVATNIELPPEGVIITDPVTILPSGQRVIQSVILGTLFAGTGSDKVDVNGMEINTKKYPNLLYPDGESTTTLDVTVNVKKVPAVILFTADKGTVESSKTVTKIGEQTIGVIYTSPTDIDTDSAIVNITATPQDGQDEKTRVKLYLYKTYNISEIISNDKFTNIPADFNSAQKIEDWLKIPHHPKSNPTIISCLAGRQGNDGRLVSQVIWDSCKERFQYTGSQSGSAKHYYKTTLNPSLALVTLQKEQGLIGINNDDPRLTDELLNFAMGAGVSSNLRDQLEYGVERLKRWYLYGDYIEGKQSKKGKYLEVGYPYLYKEIGYQYKDGSKGLVKVSVIVSNRTTYSLFKYTPYVNYNEVSKGGNWLFQNFWKQYGFDK